MKVCKAVVFTRIVSNLGAGSSDGRKKDNTVAVAQNIPTCPTVDQTLLVSKWPPMNQRRAQHLPTEPASPTECNRVAFTRYDIKHGSDFSPPHTSTFDRNEPKSPTEQALHQDPLRRRSFVAERAHQIQHPQTGPGHLSTRSCGKTFFERTTRTKA